LLFLSKGKAFPVMSRQKLLDEYLARDPMAGIAQNLAAHFHMRMPDSIWLEWNTLHLYTMENLL